MQKTKSSKQSSSGSSSTSRHHSSASTNHKNRLPSPLLSEYEYLGRSITRERPVFQTSNALHESHSFPSNINKYYHSSRTHREEIYEEDSTSSDADDFSKPLGVIRINDRHFREIYRLPTPPPEIKRVFHRLRSPKPKIIERVFVHRPPLEIIENIIEVPPEKVRIINREKYLRESQPTIRTKVVHLKPRTDDRNEQQQQPSTYPPQLNPPPVSYPQSTIPSHTTFNSPIIQPSCYNYGPPSIPLNYPHKYFQY